jgi:hypothetical protein
MAGVSVKARYRGPLPAATPSRRAGRPCARAFRRGERRHRCSRARGEGLLGELDPAAGIAFLKGLVNEVLSLTERGVGIGPPDETMKDLLKGASIGQFVRRLGPRRAPRFIVVPPGFLLCHGSPSRCGRGRPGQARQGMRDTHPPLPTVIVHLTLVGGRASRPTPAILDGERKREVNGPMELCESLAATAPAEYDCRRCGACCLSPNGSEGYVILQGTSRNGCGCWVCPSCPTVAGRRVWERSPERAATGRRASPLRERSAGVRMHGL